jgi:hypothetical protein
MPEIKNKCMWAMDSYKDIYDENTVHVYPVDELHYHMLEGPFCFCQPEIELFENGILINHRKLLQ